MDPIAIVGIGCRLPGGVRGPKSFWALLMQGVDAITEIPADRWNREAFFAGEPGKPGTIQTRWGGFLGDIDQFDPHFFGISPREAARMDPQQRLLLEVAWEALEDGGQVLERWAGSRAGVFVGVSSWDYALAQTSWRDYGTIDVHTSTGTTSSIAANRISYCFDFRGTSLAVDTACSSALTAVHLACQSIWVEGCPLALAGGVNLLLMPDGYVGFSRLGMLSPHGRCRAFAADGDGYVRSEGAGMVVLKPLAQAQQDGDRIYAVIRGTAANQDGRTPGLTVPNQAAQEALLRQACVNAGVEPGRIAFVEAHGTGTPVGDPIEARALGNVLATGRAPDRPCWLGSVKTNIGHLEAGSGIAGLIKTALALRQRCWPANLHFDRPNPNIDFAGLMLRVPVHCQPFLANEAPALAGVNSFGFGGSNAHVILEEWPAVPLPTRGACERSELVTLSARSANALPALAQEWRDLVARCPADVTLYDLAAQAASRRSQHAQRLTMVAQSKDDLLQQLTAAAGKPMAARQDPAHLPQAQRPRLAYVFSGQGPQWWAMGRQLLETEPVFRDIIRRCDTLLRPLGGWSLVEELTRAEQDTRLSETAIAQPALFALQAGLALLLQSWGIQPDAVVGHSVGEVAAAFVAGIYSLDDAVRIIFHRGRCMEHVRGEGRMLAAAVTPEEAQRLIGPYGERVSLAAVNSLASVTLSGEPEALQTIARALEERHVFHKFLRVHYAFHSAQMDPLRDELAGSLQGIKLQAARVTMLSTVVGRQVDGLELDAEYWWHNVRRTVQFAGGVAGLIDLGIDLVLELGPHPVLASAIVENYDARQRKVQVLPTLRRQQDERLLLLRTLAQLHDAGYPVAWTGVFPAPGRWVDLPTYPWQRERCWHEADEARWSRLTGRAHPLLGRRLEEPHPAWVNRLDLRLIPYLGDHRVQHAVVVPATAYLELAFATAREHFGPGACLVEDVKLTSPCLLTADRAVRLQTTYHVTSGLMEVHGRPADEPAAWTMHGRATVSSRNEEAHGGVIDPDEIQRRCLRAFSGSECSAYFQELGLEYGPAFRGIERVWQGVKEALGSVRLPVDVPADEYLFHPALLDACFQVGICADPDFNDTVGALYLPSEIDRLHFLRPPADRHVWCHARLVEKSDRVFVVDLDIFEAAGQPLIRVRGLRGLRAGGTSAAEALEELLYAYQWEQQARTIAATPATSDHIEQPGQVRKQTSNGHAPTRPQHWLLFADTGGVGERLAGHLRERGQTCTVVGQGTRYARLPVHGFQVRPGSKEDMVHLLRDMPAGTWGGIVHLWNLDAPAAADLPTPALEACQPAGLTGILHLLQAWDAASDDQTTRLFLVTRGAQAVDDAPLEVAQSPAIGLGRVIVNEYPRLRCKLIDLGPGDDGRTLIEELWATDDEDEVALRGSNRYVHRFVHAGNQNSPLPAERDSPYRVTSTRPGTLETLTVVSQRRRRPGPDEVEIEVQAAGLNFSDVMKALGLYPGVPAGPLALGAECSGRISALGDEVSGLALGTEVVAVAPGAFGSHAVAKAALVVPKPANLEFADAAAVPIGFLTAAYALEHLARLQPGERVLIHSASGGLGLAAVQLARQLGAEVFATAGTDEKRAYLKGLGIAHVFDSRTLAFAGEILETTGGAGVDVVLNSLAGEARTRSLEILADYGRFLEVGKRDLYQNASLGLRPFRKNLSFFAIDLDDLTKARPAFLGNLLRRIVAGLADGSLTPLPRQVFPAAESAAAFRHMQQAKHIGKIVLSMQDTPSAIMPGIDETLALRADGSYLITGGLGGFGLAMARWLVDHGARQLVLMGRRGVTTPEIQKVVDELARRGASVSVKCGDVANADDVDTVLTDIARTLPPLRGVLHAAMVLEDALLVNLDDDKLARVLAPKVQGAWNLHRQTLPCPLDFFVMFSSLSSVFGHAGQGNYAAANQFLDALAHHRRALGLPALTVNWGYLGDTGYLAQHPELGERLERQGVLSFSVRQAGDLFERALLRRLVQVSVMRVDWSRWRGLGATGRLSPRFAHLLQNHATPGTNGTVDARAAMQNASPAERARLVDRLLRDKAARILGETSTTVEGDKSLVQLGADSLMAVELRNWIEAEWKVALPIVELMGSPTLTALAERIAAAPSVNGHTPLPARAGSSDNRTSTSAANESFPMSHGQRGLWIVHRVEPDSAAQNIALPLRIRGSLDVEVLRQALQALLDRHGALRTTFADNQGDLVQTVHAQAQVAYDVVDASSWSEDVVAERLRAEARRPFDLQHGPMFRTHLFRRGPDDHVFLAVVHHIVGDFWSLVVALEDMRSLYNGARGDAAVTLPALAATYHDFVRWQTALLAGAEGEALWSYWQRQLAGVPTSFELPADRPRPARAAHRGAQLSCRLDESLTASLKALAAQEQVTLYTLLLGGFQVLLARYTGLTDFVVGTPVAGRSRPEFAHLMGYFVNLVPIRTDLSGNPSARAHFRKTWQTLLDAMAHQDLPFPLLIEKLHVARTHNRPPLVQILFALERSHVPAQRGSFGLMMSPQHVQRTQGDWQVETYPLDPGTCQYDLEMVLEEREDTVGGLFRFDADLFDADSVQRMVANFQTLLRALVTNPDCQVFEVPLLSETEARLLDTWNRTQAATPTDLCLHQLFEQQARRTPDAPAVTFQNHSLTYAALDDWSTRLARRLGGLGVTTEARVALVFERSLEMIVGILGTLKAGAAYVPLDPSAAPARLQSILDDVNPGVVLTHSRLAARLPRLDVPVLHLDDPVALAGDLGPLPSGARPENLAYVIFTSGTTGRPKGAMVEHRAICNSVLWQRGHLPVEPGDRYVLCLPYFFDASICSIFVALAAGAQLALPEPGSERDPARLIDFMIDTRATMVETVPSMLRLWLEQTRFTECRTLRWLTCGGETLPADLPARLFAQLPADLYNVYGPTETAVVATAWPCPRTDQPSKLPIGWPIANVRAYVLDDRRQQAPIGVPGELWIGGSGVARGYLHDPHLTAQRFVPDTFDGSADARMYRTGDTCRWLPGGTLEYLGRLDRQVKISGYRIELEELETALVNLPDIRAAAVVAHGNGIGAQRLVAYLVPRQADTVPQVERLRRQLQDKVPAYAVPAAFVTVPALPLTASGKLDRHALPAPTFARPHLDKAFEAPRTPLEKYLASLWAELLHVDEVGIHDDFFDLGGSSLLGVQLINRLQEKLAQHLFVMALFEAPTIAGLADYLQETCPNRLAQVFGPVPTHSANGTARRADLIVPLQPSGTQTPLFMVHPPGGIVNCYQPLSRHVGADLPLYGIRARGLRPEESLPVSLQEMAADYIAALRAVQAEGPYRLGGWSMGGLVALEMAQQLVERGQHVALLAMFDTTIPHNAANQCYVSGEDRTWQEYGLDLDLEKLAELGPDKQLPYLWDHARKLGLVADDTPLPLVERLLEDLKRLFHAHLTLGGAYQVRPYPGPLTLFRPTDAPVPNPGPMDRGWSQLAPVTLIMVPGQHQSMVQEPHVTTLAAKLRACLA